MLTLLGKTLSALLMGIAERKQRQKEEVYNSILQAAWQLVEKEGWQALSIRKIADAIEYSVPVIYDHFENKEAILTVFTRRGFNLLSEELLKARADHETPAEQLEAMAYAYWNFAFANPQYYQLMYGMGMPGCEAVRSMPELQRFISALKEVIEEILPKGKDQANIGFLKLNSFWSMLHGLVSINMLGRKENQHELEMGTMILKDFIKSFITGLKA